MQGLPPPDPGFEIVIASRGMSKGIAQTDGPQIIAKGFAQVGAVQIGGQWKNVDSPSAAGEGAAFVSVMRNVGEFQLGLGAAYKFQTGVRGRTDDDALEFSAALARKFGRIGVRISMVFSPDDFGGTGSSLFAEGGPTLELTKTLKLAASIGRRHRHLAADYTAFSAGLSKTVHKSLTFDVRYTDTAQSELGTPYRPRIVLAVRAAF